MKEIQVKRHNDSAVAIVDDQDYELLSAFKWHHTSTGYASTHIRIGYGGKIKGVKRKIPSMLMHRMIMDVYERSLEVDHINMNGLDNRRCNLRIVNRSMNMANTVKRRGQFSSKYKGVYWIKNDSKWASSITVNYHKIMIGRFECEDEAAYAYDLAAKYFFGEHAYGNFHQ